MLGNVLSFDIEAMIPLVIAAQYGKKEILLFVYKNEKGA